jgi:hypothetical protein
MLHEDAFEPVPLLANVLEALLDRFLNMSLFEITVVISKSRHVTRRFGSGVKLGAFGFQNACLDSLQLFNLVGPHQTNPVNLKS